VQVHFPATSRPWALPVLKGQALPKPAQVVEQMPKRHRLDVAGYGGGRRKVETLSRAGQGYQSGHGLVPVRWVCVRDHTGTPRDEFFFATRTAGSAQAIIAGDTARWNLETTFPEWRAHLGRKTTQDWSEKAVLRAAPCLFGRYGVVALLDQEAPAVPTGRAKSTAPSPTRCPPFVPGGGPNGFSHRLFPTRLSRNFRPPGSGSCSMHALVFPLTKPAMNSRGLLCWR
jgi:hypothetical protein